ncbi:MAG: hypothetical protein K2F71_05360, partial [Paramuribaculum sp.]|nr:hypothetical protein [Paramuribaculum sp.]
VFLDGAALSLAVNADYFNHPADLKQLVKEYLGELLHPVGHAAEYHQHDDIVEPMADIAFV